MSAWTCRQSDGKAAAKIVPPRPRIPSWKSLSADSEEKREPVSDIDTAVVDSLKVLDLKWPIREADIGEVSVISGAIAAAVAQQTEATQSIARNVEYAAQETSEAAASISNVSRGASET